MKTVRLNVKHFDSAGVLPRPTKCIVLGTVWEGGSAPRLDYIQEAPKDVVISLLTGEVIAELPAEGGPTDLDPGVVWNGIASQLEAAAKNARAKAEAVRTATTQDARSGGDFLSRSRAATASALETMRTETQKLWSRTTPQPTRDARTSLSSVDQIRDINEANRQFWASRSGGDGPKAA